MHAVVSSRAARGGVRGRRARWIASALAVAALTSGTGLTAGASAHAVPGNNPLLVEEPLDCPSAGCEQVARFLKAPHGVALDSEGNAYVITGSGLVKVDRSTGKTEVVATGLGKAPLGVALDGQGHAYVPDFDSGSLRKVDLATGKSTPVAGGLGKPHQVALDGAGRAYVTDKEGNTLWEVNLATGRTRQVSTGIGSPLGVALDGKGTAYVSAYNEGKIYAVSLRTGRKRPVAEGLKNPEAIAVGSTGKLYVADHSGAGQLWSVDPANGSKHALARGMKFPVGVALDREGNAWVADRDAGVLWRVAEADGPGDPGPPPPPSSGKVRIENVFGVWTSPGRNAVPRVKVTNTSGRYLGKEDITLTLGPSRVNWSYNVVYTDRDGTTHEYPCTVHPDDSRKSLCKGVDLHLEAGQSAELRTEVGVSKDAQICEFPSITWNIAGTSAKSDFVIKKPDGTPDRC
ncbi:Vgb family protein [Streptomyces flavidovirens]